MVTRNSTMRNKITRSSAMLCLSLLALPGQAQGRQNGILQQMQDEVAAIAKQARSAIVTIEDSRALAVNYISSPLRQTDLQDQIAHVLIDKKAVDAEVARQQEMYNAGTVTLLELDKPRHEQARLEAKLAYLRKRLANAGHEDTRTQQNEERQERIAELQIDQTYLGRQEKILQAQVNAGQVNGSELQEAKRQLEHVELELKTARQQLAAQTAANAAAQKNRYEVTGVILRSPATATYNTPKSGSGFSIGDGYIVTTADVVQGMSNPVVTTDDGRQIRAALVAVDKELNIGLLRLTASTPLAALKLGDSAGVAPGHFAISIGNQTGQINSVALSMVSGLRTQGMSSDTHYYPDLLQIDGTIGAGTSGAPVLNARGEVIGMLAAVPNSEAAPSASSDPSNTFLWPPNSTMRLTPPIKLPYSSLAPLLKGSKVQSAPGSAAPDAFAPSLKGGEIQEAPKEKAEKSLKMPPEAKSQSRIYTKDGLSVQLYDKAQERSRTLLPSAPASAYTYDVGTRLYQTAAGATPGFTFTRSITSVANSGFAIPVNELKSALDELKTGKNAVHVWLGVNLEDMDNARAENGIVRLDKQVRVRSVYKDSPAAKMSGAGAKNSMIQPGDVLISLNNVPIHTGNEVRSALLRFKPGQTVTAAVLRAGKSQNVTLTLEPRPASTPSVLSTAPLSELGVHF